MLIRAIGRPPEARGRMSRGLALPEECPPRSPGGREADQWGASVGGGAAAARLRQPRRGERSRPVSTDRDGRRFFAFTRPLTAGGGVREKCAMCAIPWSSSGTPQVGLHGPVAHRRSASAPPHAGVRHGAGGSAPRPDDAVAHMAHPAGGPDGGCATRSHLFTRPFTSRRRTWRTWRTEYHPPRGRPLKTREAERSGTQSALHAVTGVLHGLGRREPPDRGAPRSGRPARTAGRRAAHS
jgi:hypothetical protein